MIPPVPVPAENTVVSCRYCDRKIFFARTEKGASMPLEARPIKVFTVPPLGPGEREHRCLRVQLEIDFFIPHWGNCPGADDARRKGEE